MRERAITRLLALAAVAMSAWICAARAEEFEQRSGAAGLGEGLAALRPIFAAAEPPNFQLSIEAEFDSGGTVKVSRKLVKNVSVGIVRMPFSERRMVLSAADGEPCQLDGTLVAFFGGLQLSSASGVAECGGGSSAVEGRLTAVAGINGALFPVQRGNALSFAARSVSEMVDLFPSAVHRLKVIAMLSGVTLDATGAPDVIYLIRHDEAPDEAATPIVTDIYWSAGLRWPIQARVRTDDGKAVFIERDLLRVAGVMPYVLPDGRAVSSFDERTKGSHPLTEIDGMARALWRAGKNSTTQDVDALARVASKVVAPGVPPMSGIDPAFASIASLVAREESTQSSGATDAR